MERIENPIKVEKSVQVPPSMAQVTKVVVDGKVAYVRENVRDGKNILELLAPVEAWARIASVIALEDDQKREVHPAPADFTYEWAWKILKEGPDEEA